MTSYFDSTENFTMGYQTRFNSQHGNFFTGLLFTPIKQLKINFIFIYISLDSCFKIEKKSRKHEQLFHSDMSFDVGLYQVAHQIKKKQCVCFSV